MALFDRDGEAPFFLSYRPLPVFARPPKKYRWIPSRDYRELQLNNSGSSSLKRGSEHTERAESVTVTTRRLDAWASERGIDCVDFVWLDVQGAERRVLAGMRETLARSRAAVVFEFESDYAEDPPGEIRDILDTIPEHRVFRIRPGRPEIEPFDPATVDVKGYWANLLALPRDGWGT